MSLRKEQKDKEITIITRVYNEGQRTTNAFLNIEYRTTYTMCLPGNIHNVLHNVSGYVAHLFIKGVGQKFNKDDIGVIAENKKNTLGLMPR